jgi:hypothetical protein
MYHLTLTAGERKAIDWIGNRYDHGHDLFKLLWVESYAAPNSADWDYAGDITFSIPEFVAWDIRDMGERNNYLWDCFAPELVNKLNAFCDKIV